MIRCDYCGDGLPSVTSRKNVPTPPLLQRMGFQQDKIVCPECVGRALSAQHSPCRAPDRCTWKCNGHCATCEWCAWKHENRATSHPDDLL